MTDAAEKAVERVVASMRENLGEELTVDDMARVAMFSKFHFTRIFQRVTGVSPGRFLSALRLQQAKRLLVSTNLTVSDISMRVGYSSVGTFSARFARSVGMPPTEYRRIGGYPPHIVKQRSDGLPTGVVSGCVRRPQLAPAGPIFLGLFATRVPEGRPASCTILRGPGPFLLERVPAGSWYLLAQSVPSTEVDSSGASPQATSVATHGPVELGAQEVIDTGDIHLSPMRDVDPPVLLALLDARRVALDLVTDRRAAVQGAMNRLVAFDHGRSRPAA